MKKKWFWRFTNRCWIPDFLTNEKGQRVKWVFWLVGLVFIIFFILWFLGIAMGQDIFFKDWKVKSITPNDGLVVVMVNPDSEGDVKAVKVIATPNGIILAYGFFQREQPQVWILTEGGYARDRNAEATCGKCHIPKADVRL